MVMWVENGLNLVEEYPNGDKAIDYRFGSPRAKRGGPAEQERGCPLRRAEHTIDISLLVTSVQYTNSEEQLLFWEEFVPRLKHMCSHCFFMLPPERAFLSHVLSIIMLDLRASS